MRDYPRFLRRDEFGYGWDILWFRIWRFHFRWFTDYGEWFIYLEWQGEETYRGVRFSSDGFMRYKRRKRKKQDENV